MIIRVQMLVYDKEADAQTIGRKPCYFTNPATKG